MIPALTAFAARVRAGISAAESRPEQPAAPPAAAGAAGFSESEFNRLALELFALQFRHNPAYRRLCEARQAVPGQVRHWAEVPTVPAPAFKEFEFTCLPAAERTRVFHSSGTTGARPSQHFHCADSLALYEASLWPWLRRHFLPELPAGMARLRCAFLTPPPAQAPHSSLVHMFDTVGRNWPAAAAGGSGPAGPPPLFLGHVAADGAWTVDLPRAVACLEAACATGAPLALLGTAFSWVHLLDFLAEQDRRFRLPDGSRALETGGYKGRSRVLPRAELHARLCQQLGLPPAGVVSEYGMSELSSQAYDAVVRSGGGAGEEAPRAFRFPPWARVQIVSPESSREVADGQVGLVRVFDLANVWSVMAIQTEDLGVRRGDGFEWAGRAGAAEPRGCSLLAEEAGRRGAPARRAAPFLVRVRSRPSGVTVAERTGPGASSPARP